MPKSSKSKRKHHSSSSKDQKKVTDKSSDERPSKFKLRIQEAQVELEAVVRQVQDHLTGECQRRSNEQDAKIQALQKQLVASEQAKTKNLQKVEKVEKLNCKTIRDLEAKIHGLSMKVDQILAAGRYDQCGTPEALSSSFVAVTPSTSCNTLRGESGRGVVLQMPGIRAFTSKNEVTSQQVFIVDVDRSVSASDLFEQPAQHGGGLNFDQEAGLIQEDNGRNSHGSVDRIHSWMKDSHNHLVESQLEDQNAGDGLSLLERVSEKEQEQDPLADPWADFPQSYSDNEADQREPSPVRRPLKSANHAKNKRVSKSATPTKQAKTTTSNQLRPPKGKKSGTVDGKRIWTGKKRCHICQHTTTRTFCASRKCGLPVCGKDSEKRNYCKNYNPVLGACCREDDGYRTMIKQAEDVCSQTIDGKRVYKKKSKKRELAAEQGRCEDCKLVHDRKQQKISRTRCDCCHNFYCKPHRNEPVIECIKHRDELPCFTTDTEVQSSVYEDAYDSDTLSNYHPSPPKRRAIAATSNSPKRRISSSSTSSNNSTPLKKHKVSDSEASGYRHSVPLPKELRDYSYLLTIPNHKYGL